MPVRTRKIFGRCSACYGDDLDFHCTKLYSRGTSLMRYVYVNCKYFSSAVR